MEKLHPTGQPSRYRILVVEDNAENAQFLTQLLSLVGFEVQQAANGRNGLAVWEAWKPDLILMDMQMPVMDGYETTRQIRIQERAREAKENLPQEWDNGTTEEWHDHLSKLNSSTLPPTAPTIIIAVTGSAFEEDRTQILATGCDDFIRKPVQENLLFARLAHHLGVHYRYENTELHSSTSQPSPVTLSATSLSAMPIDWRKQLNVAARECHQIEVMRQLNQIPEEHEALALALKQLAMDFRFEDIAALTSQE